MASMSIAAEGTRASAVGGGDADEADSEATLEIFRNLGLNSDSSAGDCEMPHIDFSSEDESSERNSSCCFGSLYIFIVFVIIGCYLGGWPVIFTKSFRSVSFVRARVRLVWLADGIKSQRLRNFLSNFS